MLVRGVDKTRRDEVANSANCRSGPGHQARLRRRITNGADAVGTLIPPYQHLTYPDTIIYHDDHMCNLWCRIQH